MMFVAFIATIHIGGAAATCIEGLLPRGHVQVNIHSGGSAGHLNLTYNTITVSDSCLDGFVPPPAAYLLVVRDAAQFPLQLEALSCNHLRWWPWVWTVVLLRTEATVQGAQFARSAIALLWKKAVYNVAVYVESEKIVYRADPFAKGNGCGHEAVNIYRGDCSYTVPAPRRRFPGCLLHVSARESFPFSSLTSRGFVGYDVKLAQVIASRSGLNIRWSSRPSQQSSSYSLAHAYYENLSRNELDLAIGGSVLSLSYFNNVTYVYSHATQYLYFYVPDGVELRGWQRLVAMFSGSIWLYILLTVLSTVLILSIFGKGNASEYFLVVVGLLLQETVKLPHGRLRIVLVCIVFPFYYISSMYTTILHSYTMNPPSSTGISSLDQLLESNLTVVLSDTNKLLTDQVGARKVREVLRKSWPSPGLREAARLLDKERNFCLAERDIEINVLIARYGYTVHKVDYKVATIRNSLVHPKGSLYASRIHEIVMRCLESGILERWMRDEIGAMPGRSTGFSKRPIAWHDVDSAFVILFVGHVTAAITFLTEILVEKITRQTEEAYTYYPDVFY